MEPRTPPRYVPTLTKVIDANTATPAAAPVARTTDSLNKPAATPAAPNIQKPRPAQQSNSVTTTVITKRVMQRVDLTLHKHLREATTQVALEFSRNMAQQMRPMIEEAVRKAVQEAVDAERNR